MTENELQQISATLSRPYTITKSKLGVVTKLFSETFICKAENILTLEDGVCEKLNSFNPSKFGFHYLISFTDHTHIEGTNVKSINNDLTHIGKCTERLILKWSITHKIISGEEEIENEVTVIVRLTNPINPLIFLQAALSKTADDIDNLEFSDNAVSVSVDGASHTTCEEVFGLVKRWIDGCPQPQPLTTIIEVIRKIRRVIKFMNYWLIPVFFTFGFFLYLLTFSSMELMLPIIFIGLILHEYLRNIGGYFNYKLDDWLNRCERISVFEITGGDANQQTKYFAKSRNNTLKLIVSTSSTLLLNILAGIAVAKLIGNIT